MIALAESIFLPVYIECPGKLNGVFKMITQNTRGKKQKFVVTYLRKQPIDIVAFNKLPNEKEVKIGHLDLKLPMNVSQRNAANQIIKKVDPVYKQICNGSNVEKEAYEEFLQQNRIGLSMGAIDDEKYTDPSKL